MFHIFFKLLALFADMGYEARTILEDALQAAYNAGVAEERSKASKPVPAAVVRSIVMKLAGGNKIAAIKEWRTYTGLGLKEAKEEIDSIAAAFGVNPVPYCLDGSFY